MGFIKSPLIKSFRKFDSSLFTQRGVNGIRGLESMPRDQCFKQWREMCLHLTHQKQLNNLKNYRS